MTNREKLEKMTLFEMLMYFDMCEYSIGFSMTRCKKYMGDCKKCRMDWLDEPAKKEEKLNENA